MTALRLLDQPHYTDHLRLRDGKTVTVRFAAPDDAERLQRYFRLLSEVDGLALYGGLSISPDAQRANSAGWVDLIARVARFDKRATLAG